MMILELMSWAGMPVSRQMRELPHLLSYAKAFTFGEKYKIVFNNSWALDVRTLDTMISVIHDEFMVAKNYDLRMCFFQNNLVLEPKVELGQVWNRNVNRDCGRILDWVTTYNLSGDWPEEVRVLDWPRGK